MLENLISTDLFYFKDIPGADDWVELLRISDGNSSDLKYSARNNEGKQFYIRLAEPTSYDRVKGEYEHLKAAASIGVPVPVPIGFGLCGNGRSLYLQTNWIPGQAGEDILKNLPKCRQYELGITAGLCIKMIHACPAPARTSKFWETKQLKRWQTIRGILRGSAIKIPFEKKLVDMIGGSLHLLCDRPQRLVHGAFHTGNIVLTYEHNLRLVDLHGWQYGDPLFDMAHIMATTDPEQRAFAMGVLDCYFVYAVDDRSLNLMNLYAALELVEQIEESRKLQNKTDAAIERVEIFVRDLQGCRQICPTWYKRMRCSI